MRSVLAAFSVLLFVTACQAPPAEMTEAEIAQIQAEVMEVLEGMLEGARQLDADMMMAGYHPTETAWVWGSVPQGYERTRELWQNWTESVQAFEVQWTETKVKVLSRDAAMFQGNYECTRTNQNGRKIHYPGNASWTMLLERTPDGWKVTMGDNGAGTGVRIEHVYGTYAFSRIEDSDLPNDTYSSATLEWRLDGSWTVTSVPADGSDPVESHGESTVGPGPEGCLASTGWNVETPDQPFSSVYCDGVLTADDGTWIANQRN